MAGIIVGIVGAAIGIIPWLLQQKGVTVPAWVIISGGWLTILAIGYCAYYPMSSFITKLLQQKPRSDLYINISIVPFVLLGALIGTAGMWWTMYEPPTIHYEASDWIAWNEQRMETVTGKIFMNTEVRMDGKSFIGNTFENVTFVYEGKAPIQLIGNTVIGIKLIKAPPAFDAFCRLLSALGYKLPLPGELNMPNGR